MRRMKIIAAALLLALLTLPSFAQNKPRGRDLGIPFDGTPGPLNAITDVRGVEVGMTTIVRGDGKEAVRTGVTVVLPRGKESTDPVFAAWFSQNGNGEMTGTTWIEEGGFMECPVFITNTHSVGVVRDASIAWSVKQGKLFQPWSLPVVAETYDGTLNDINGFHVPGNDRVPDDADTARVGQHQRAVEEARLLDPRRARHLAVAV